MDKYIHFYTYVPSDKLLCSYSYDETNDLLIRGQDIIYTTEMSLLSTRLFEYGYRIFIHERTETYEIKLGVGNKHTMRDVRLGHNIFKLWSSGEFSQSREKRYWEA